MGTVTDEAGNPIENIKVKVMRKYDNGYVQGIDSTYTDLQGKYRTGEFEDGNLDWEGKIAFIDEDGATNGAFVNDTVAVNDQPHTQYKKNDGWYSGAYEVTADVKLKKQDND